MELEDFLREKKKEGMLREVTDISNLISPCYVRQKTAQGLGHAVLVCKELIGNEPFAASLLAPSQVSSKSPWNVG